MEGKERRRTVLLFGGRLGVLGGEFVLPVPPGGTLPWKFEPEFMLLCTSGGCCGCGYRFAQLGQVAKFFRSRRCRERDDG